MPDHVGEDGEGEAVAVAFAHVHRPPVLRPKVVEEGAVGEMIEGLVEGG